MLYYNIGDLTIYTNFPDGHRDGTNDGEDFNNYKKHQFADCEPSCTRCSVLFDYGFGKAKPGIPGKKYLKK